MNPTPHQSLSACHNAPAIVRSDSFGEGTNHYECTECHEPCDLAGWTTPHQSDELDIGRVLEEVFEFGYQEGLAGRTGAIKLGLKTSHFRATIEALIEQREQQYDEIFKWLLGQAGEFPPSEPGKRYGWRTELRHRLASFTKRKEDV